MARHSIRLDRRRAAAIDSIQFWLLAAGALVLVAVTVWIVWPGALADELANPEPLPNQEEIPMSLDREPPTPPQMAPQGDRFEDQYTSATSDLSAGGVAAAGGPGAAFQSAQEGATAGAEPRQTPAPGASGASQTPRSSPVLPAPSQYALPAPSRTRVMLQPRNVAIGAGVAAGLGAVAGGWFYTRWQREQNRPINRLRRGAKDVADLVADRLALDELPDKTAPVGGAAALALTSLVLSRALRSSADDTEDSDEEDTRVRRWASRAEALSGGSERLSDALRSGLSASTRRAEALSGGSERLSDALRSGVTASTRKARRAARDLPSVDLPSVDLDEVRSRSTAAVGGKRGAFMGLGASGLIAVAASAYVIWRLLRGNPPRTYPQPM